MNHPAPIEAAILDWAGTILDFGSRAPAIAFVELFRRNGADITVEEARGPMGTNKRDHIEHLLAEPRIAALWKAAHGHDPNGADTDRLYAEFLPLQLDVLRSHSALIPGVLDAVAAVRARGIKIGSTTGYARPMMDINMEEAARQGLTVDACATADDVPAGRPAPHMCLKNAIALGVTAVWRCVKVDDTVPGIAEGINAGMWTVGVAVSGNEVGLSPDEWRALAEAEKACRRAGAAERLKTAGAHYVVDSVAQLPCCIDDIERRLALGERP
jgi:phosphonoacetaldehyde hydrolase